MLSVSISICPCKKMQMIVSNIFSNPKKESFSKDSNLGSTFIVGKIYNIFEVKPLHNFHFGTHKLLKESTFKFLGSDRVVKKRDRVLEQSNPISLMRMSPTLPVNPLHVVDDRDAFIPGVHLDVSSNGYSVYLNDLFQNNDVLGILDGKDYHAVHIVLLTLAVYIDRAAGF